MVLWSLGLAVVVVAVARVVLMVFRYTVKRPLDLQERYGKGSWALVTGGSEGIGRAFAESVAGKGFNVLIAARSETKLEKTAADLRKRFPAISIETHSIDFYECRDAGFAQRVADMVKDKDISLLINNVGISYGGEFAALPLSKLHSELVLCDEATLQLTHLLLPRLLARGKKAGIVFNSGLTALYPAPGLAVHSGTKAFEHYFADALQYELRGKVDVLSLLPAAVSSQRLQNLRPNLITSSCEDIAEGAVRDLGQYFVSFGSLKHAFQALFLSILPRWVRLRMLAVMVNYMIRHHGL